MLGPTSSGGLPIFAKARELKPAKISRRHKDSTLLLSLRSSKVSGIFVHPQEDKNERAFLQGSHTTKKLILIALALFISACATPKVENNAEAYTNRGAAYHEKGQYDKAISDYDKAIEINPKYAHAYVNRGTAYRKKGQYDKAISDCNKAIEINPRYAHAYLIRGHAYLDGGQRAKACKDFKKAERLDHSLIFYLSITLRGICSR